MGSEMCIRDRNDTVRLNKRMADLGLCSRREADDWIGRGWVRVDGATASMGMQVGPQARIEVDKRAQGQQQQQVTILLHKPVGYVSGQAEDGYQPAVTLVQDRTHWNGDASRHRFSPAQLARLRHGLTLDGRALKPARVDWQNPEQLRFVLTEGRKRQIRRMCELVGLRVVGLKRVRIGRVALGQLPQGSWRYLGAQERF